MNISATTSSKSVSKKLTGIQGLDEITNGGLPAERTTLVCGGPGCGKTLLSMQFLLQGILQYNEPGVFITFEEHTDELVENFASLGFDLAQLITEKKLAIEFIKITPPDLTTGEYDLEALFVRINYAITSIHAKRIVLDTIEALFNSFTDESLLRTELRRLFDWLKERQVTAIITGEKGDGNYTRYGLEEYVSDCVIFLDHRVENQLSTRRLRIVKYRGSLHGTNEYPFLIDNRGISVLPITSVGLHYPVTNKRVSTGVKELDTMFEGKGYYKGSTVLISGTAGTGKTSLAALFSAAACKRGEKCLYFAFEESASQIIRNMTSIGIDFNPWIEKGTLRFHTVRPTLYGLEMHLVQIHKIIHDFQPDVVVLDPISNLISQGDAPEVKAMLLRIIDFLKLRNVTTVLTNLTSKNEDFERIEINVSSIADTWIVLRDIESNNELQRGLYVVKSRGMSHSNKVKTFEITNTGIRFIKSDYEKKAKS